MLTKKDYKAIGLIFRKHLEVLPDEILSDFGISFRMITQTLVQRDSESLSFGREHNGTRKSFYSPRFWLL